MNAGRTSQLRQTTDQSLDLFWGDHHQVRQFVDNNHDGGQVLQRRVAVRYAFGTQLAIPLQVAHIHLGENAIAFLHLGRRDLEQAHHFIDFGDDWGQQVRDAVVHVQFHHFRVDHQHAHVLGGGLHEKTANDGIEAHAFPRAGSPGN